MRPLQGLRDCQGQEIDSNESSVGARVRGQDLGGRSRGLNHPGIPASGEEAASVLGASISYRFLAFYITSKSLCLLEWPSVLLESMSKAHTRAHALFDPAVVRLSTGPPSPSLSLVPSHP